MARNNEDVDASFDQGFYGEHFAAFEKMGETTVRDQLRSGTLPSEAQRTAAIEWLGRQEAHAKRQASRRANIALALSILSIQVALVSLAATLLLKPR
jgi:hypothetical protein